MMGQPNDSRAGWSPEQAYGPPALAFLWAPPVFPMSPGYGGQKKKAWQEGVKGPGYTLPCMQDWCDLEPMTYLT